MVLFILYDKNPWGHAMKGKEMLQVVVVDDEVQITNLVKTFLQFHSKNIDPRPLLKSWFQGMSPRSPKPA
ncbi:MAG: hypothetical protein MUF22_01345 [Chitinispirillaceae bacterium]|nr:hypothetical protein [Chitinispirillaceae bacterium]